MNPTLTEEQRLLLQQSKVIAAYRRVFGTDDATRTADQLTVWHDLEILGYAKKGIFKADKNGAVCPFRAAIADGHRDFFLYIEANATASPEVIEQQTQKKR